MMAKLTMLNWMASKDFNESLDIQKAWGIEVLDMKDHIFGKSVENLSYKEAEQAVRLIEARNMSVHCLSTLIFQDDIEKGERQYGGMHLQSVERVLDIAALFKPTFIRLLPARLPERRQTECSRVCIERQYPWLYRLYQTAVDQISEAGYAVTIENEKSSIFSNVDDILDFFMKLNRSGNVSLTYDVQNLWQMGTFPSMDVYRNLKPLIGYLHVKGGQAEPGAQELKWKSSLEDASWPVEPMIKQAVKDNVSPVICLNPTYGQMKENYDYNNMFKRDLDYMKQIMSRIERCDS
ncbi:sugar phosphate isomerase/epimerase family protein [Paenibacillus piri]|nr:TIM barrel protein [Paenibacillus piri]